MLGQAFTSVSELLSAQENDSRDWHCAAIYGHTKQSKLFPLTGAEYGILEEMDVRTVSQIYGINDLTGDLDVSENEALIQALPTPLLQFKIRELVKALRHLPRRDKRHVTRSQATNLFNQDSNMSRTNGRIARAQKDAKIKTAPLYQTRRRDQVYVPDLNTFHDSYKVLKLAAIPSKTKETTFQILNRTIWTNNKAYKSRMADTPNCERCGGIETMEHLLHNCEHYSVLVWHELGQIFTDTLMAIVGRHIARIELTPKEIIFNKPHPFLLLHLPEEKDRTMIIILVQEIKRDIVYRRMNMPLDPTRATPQVRIQAHLLSVLKKLQSLYSYQGIQQDSPPLILLNKMIDTSFNRVP
jgi:hypothetical protein